MRTIKEAYDQTSNRQRKLKAALLKLINKGYDDAYLETYTGKYFTHPEYAHQNSNAYQLYEKMYMQNMRIFDSEPAAKIQASGGTNGELYQVCVAIYKNITDDEYYQ
jgi:hypothetical protein